MRGKGQRIKRHRIKRHRIRNKFMFSVMIWIFCLLLGGLGAFAEEKRPLIQTTTPKEEFQGMVNLGLLFTPINEGGKISESIQNVLDGIVQIQEGIYRGSGTIVSVREDSVIVASNKHLLSHQEFAAVKFHNGEKANGRRLAMSDAYDLGFLTVDISNWDYEQRAKLRCVVYSAEKESRLKAGDAMFVVGSTDGVAVNIYQGSVADPWYYFDEFDSYMVYNYCNAKGGMSGGGTFDRSGYYIGMITGGIDGETASLPAKIIQSEMQKLIR